MELGACDNNPTHFHLVRLWMLSKHPGVQAIVFFSPMNHVEAIGKKFDIPWLQLIHSDIYVLRTSDPEACSTVNNLEEDEFGYVMLWNGANFITENT